MRRQIVYDLHHKVVSDSIDLEILGTGKEERDLYFAKDQVDRIKILADSPSPAEDSYNVDNGTSVRTYDVASQIMQMTGISKTIRVSDIARVFDGY